MHDHGEHGNKSQILERSLIRRLVQPNRASITKFTRKHEDHWVFVPFVTSLLSMSVR